jgi:hypothetical protein
MLRYVVYALYAQSYLEFVKPDLFDELLPCKEGSFEDGKLPGVFLQPEWRRYVQISAKPKEAILKAVPEGTSFLVIPGFRFPYELSFQKQLTV